MTRESTVFEALRVLSVLLITMSTQMPVAQSKLPPPFSPLLAADIWFRLNTQLQCKDFSNWILAFIDTRAEPPPAIAPPPQWAAPSCNGLRAPT